MPLGPIMMGVATMPSGLGPQNNDTSNFFGTTKFPIRGHEPVPFAWYLSVFTGLIMFLLVISIAEVFCKKDDILNEDCVDKEENLLPPPPYEDFAPPPYNSLDDEDSKKKRKIIEVFVLPISTSANDNSNNDGTHGDGISNFGTASVDTTILSILSVN